jgi:hypothetical protein
MLRNEHRGSNGGVVVVENGPAPLDINDGNLGSLEKAPVPRFMEKGPVPRLDEYVVDFSDTRMFCVRRWIDIVRTTTERLNASGIGLIHAFINSIDILQTDKLSPNTMIGKIWPERFNRSSPVHHRIQS